MYKSITQDDQNDKQISKSIRRFFTRFHVSSALKTANAYKKKGTPAMEIFQYPFLLIFSNGSMYMNLISGRNTPAFAKDTVYHFMKILQINWIRFTTILAARSIRDAIVPLRTLGYKRRILSMQKGTHAMLELLKAAKKAAIPVKYVLFDS